MLKTATRNRITDILFDHWNDVRGERFFPAKEQISEKELKNKGAWEDVFIIEVLPKEHGNNYRFAYTGNNLGREILNNNVNIINGLLEHSTDKYNIVAEQKRPAQEAGSLELPGGASIKYRQILLPLGNDDDAPVNYIVGGIRFIHE